MTTLYSSIIKLTNLHPATLTHLGGQHAHAAFLDIVRSVDSSLAQRLHDLNGRKPFTVSPLMGLPRKANHQGHQGYEGERQGISLREGWECCLRVTILDDGLFKTFIEYFMGSNGKTLPETRLGDAHFCVSEILTSPGSHTWAGYVTMEDLQKRLDEPPPVSIMFELLSPITCIR